MAKTRKNPAAVKLGRQGGLYKAFRESGCGTLDEFVQAAGNRKFLPLVKASMISVLIESEQQNNLFPDLPENRNPHTMAAPLRDWYGYLFDHMRTASAEG